MSSLWTSLNDRNNTAKARAAKAERREARQEIYDALANVVDHKPGRRKAWSINSEPEASRSMLPGLHPGDSAVGMVHEALADYNMGGTLSLRYGGMDRKAGRGGHGIEEGTIYVEAELKPVCGMTAHFTVPVVVRDAKMLFPGMLVTANGIPRVLAQSTFDDLSANVTIDHSMYADQRSHGDGVVASKWSSLRDVMRNR